MPSQLHFMLWGMQTNTSLSNATLWFKNTNSNSLNENGTITLLDAAGRIIRFQEFTGNSSNETIELSGLNDLNAGIYFIEVEMGSKKAVQKLVK